MAKMSRTLKFLILFILNTFPPCELLDRFSDIPDYFSGQSLEILNEYGLIYSYRKTGNAKTVYSLNKYFVNDFSDETKVFTDNFQKFILNTCVRFSRFNYLDFKCYQVI